MNSQAAHRMSSLQSEASETTIDGCRQLWCAVLMRAVMDALSPNPYSDVDRRAKRDAISWLDGGGRDFKQVCTLAGLDPEAVHDAWKSGRFTMPMVQGRR